ncbi:Peptidase M23 [Pseudoxanthomonas suwonensis 11-1]|uniref:Peptidase M23 n=2 Tax=Pseudoxanthomonas suwonensis TaxID=314722 RepID=E6WQX6_PSEUU|nr:peptidoglycan DD-metalloendopeptidase family protein [Pseudoxanthomonas suwonensis]ADV26648.1 Peptidase M23 [Pseudoxanthomonas suwonensis 11-1]
MIPEGRSPSWRLLAALALMAMLAACGKSTVVRSPAAGSGTSGTSAAPSQGQPGASVVVQRGDTLYSIARRNNVTVADMARWNRLSAPYTIYPGQRLALGASSGSTASSGTSKPPAKGTTTIATGKPATPASSTGTTAGTTTTAPAPRPAAAPVASGIRWQWPAQGVTLSTYVEGNATRQGIDIGGSSGQAVNAAADGVVVYSGAGLVGYGELIIVKHNEQWLSAYGHNRKRLVSEGQAVKAGQQIAEMGRTGTDREKLHFEIRYNGKPVDPLLYLPKK